MPIITELSEAEDTLPTVELRCVICPVTQKESGKVDGIKRMNTHANAYHKNNVLGLPARLCYVRVQIDDGILLRILGRLQYFIDFFPSL